jgi:predicted nucleotidyltransferase
MPYKISPEQGLSIAIETICEFTAPDKIILFGSRAIETAQKYSDFDFAVEGMNISAFQQGEMRDTLDDRMGIYIVDVVNMDEVEDDFKKIILNTGKVVYER